MIAVGCWAIAVESEKVAAKPAISARVGFMVLLIVDFTLVEGVAACLQEAWSGWLIERVQLRPLLALLRAGRERSPAPSGMPSMRT